LIGYKRGIRPPIRIRRPMSLPIPARLILALVAAPLALATTGCVVTPVAPPPAPQHPAYLHALTDLREARWNLEHRPGDAAVSAQEDVAIVETERAIDEAKAAATEDGKNIHQHPPEDARIDRRGRLHHADELLRKARNDVAQAEDNPATRDLRNRVLAHVDAAIQATDRAIRDVEQGR
jgi:hypothetical protein